ncbi:DUF2279 domain-containing protein [Xanthocytophaga agilis]|uniref:DUF2279 domain-containing protein n=1 Tax=Xanthocytophaga agilis TaxID=3048010 RepID=A0AAE3R6V8_9BACT|nr:DUF2279 domain-containing protein [Xanthocytophaga agilis]MDJ1502549.1 DUF2279 domain-containing protein [Xanthocytophaga agilis]
MTITSINAILSEFLNSFKEYIQRTILVSLVFAGLAFSSSAQTSNHSDSTFSFSTVNKQRLRTLVIGGSTVYAATLTGLNFLWYADEPRSSFHFFDDNSEWQQVDKVGHFYTAYHISRIGVQAFQWTGMPRCKSIWWGGLMGVIFQTPIEVLDGFSAAYGASWGDLTANTVGSGLLIGQLLLWDEERIHPKFSFYPTSLAKVRPHILGDNLIQQSLKDYNGQTYWLAFDIKPWLKQESNFPDWLCISLGYGAQNMISADNAQSRLAGYIPYRQYYLSLDINFTKIHTKNRFLKSLFFLLNNVHIPAPALEWNHVTGFKAHPLYF